VKLWCKFSISSASVVVIFVLLLSLSGSGDLLAKGDRPTGRQLQQDDYWHFTSVGNVGLTVTNYGVLGNRLGTIEDQFACRYKTRTNLPKEEVTHFSYAGIWVGGKKGSGVKHVSTSVYDNAFGYDDGGWEFTSSATNSIKDTPIFRHVNSIDRRFDLSGIDTFDEVIFGNSTTAEVDGGFIDFPSTSWDTIITRSNMSDASQNNPYWRYAQMFDPRAVSHQDLITAFTDTNLFVPGTGISIPEHEPLGIHVYLETYAWSYPFADSFVILNYTVTNIPTGWTVAENDTTVEYAFLVEREFAAGDTIWLGDAIKDPVFGIWIDASVGNLIYTPDSPQGGPGGDWYWSDNLNGYDQERRMGYQYDFDGDAGWAQSYLGLKVLGADPRSENYDAYFHQWTWGGTEYNDQWPMPQNESERYDFMASPGNYANIYTTDTFQESWMIFMSCGPMPHLAPGERFNVSLGVICGLWNGGGGDSEERRKNFNVNADWCQMAYDGEDRNGNGVLDPGEDTDGDGVIDRYILPAAPTAPQLVVVPGDKEATLIWNDVPEHEIDPITNNNDFEGYRIYGSPKTVADGEDYEWTLLADFDIDFDIYPEDDDSVMVGYNIGMGEVSLDSMVQRGVKTQAEVDSIRFVIQEAYGFEAKYMWTNYNVKNGWPRELYYSITSYDKGNPETNLPSLESSRDANRVYVYTGTPPTQPGDESVGVYPNPYRGRAQWDGLTGRDRLLWFRNLPSQCEVKIFTLAGELVDEFNHNASTYSGQDVQAITGGSSDERRVFSGGEHGWDLLSKDDQEIATGLYIFTVEDLSNGDVKTGKFLVIK